MPLNDPKTDWPAASDVTEFLSATGLFSASLASALTALETDIELELGAAISQIETWTGWVPFLARTETRLFDPPGPERGPVGVWAGMANSGGGRRLFLGCGLLSLTGSTLTTGLTATNAAGEVLTQGQDFWLRPASAPNYQKPYTSLEFRAPQWGEPESISIPGLWGFSEGVPLPAWRAAVKLAAAAVAPQVDLLVNQGVLSRKAGDEEQRFSGGRDVGPVAAAAAQWRDDAEKLIARGNYQRVSL